jgi:uncharacterized surface protein with fasciclin (FAS1) repeats
MKEPAMATKVLAALVSVAGVLMLPACGDGADESDASAEVSDETLASVVEDADGLSVVSDALGDAGLAQVFDGAASYTLFAPQDEAFDALGQAGEELRTPEQRAAMVAILRDHIVPGYLTPEDIANAIELADDGNVEMRTMGGHTLTFTSANNAVIVNAEDGASAKFAGEALRASNGVAVPLDGVLKKVVVDGG